MKTTLKILLFSSALFFAACTEDEPVNPDVTPAPGPAEMQNLTANSEYFKSFMSDELPVFWNTGDTLALWTSLSDTTKSGLYTINEGGSISSSLALLSETNTHLTTGTVGFFPYSSSLTCVEKEDSYTVSGIKIPEDQFFVDGYVSPDANPVIALSTETGAKELNFKNLLGVLKITLNGEDTLRVADITVVPQADGESVCGVATATTSASNDPILSFDNDSTLTLINLSCGKEGVSLTKGSKDFYVTLPPREYTKGFLIIVNTTNCGAIDIYENSPIEIKRSEITPITLSATPNGVINLDTPSAAEADETTATFKYAATNIDNTTLGISTSASWLTACGDTTTNVITLNFSENTSQDDRTATITVWGTDIHGKNCTASCEFTQKGTTTNGNINITSNAPKVAAEDTTAEISFAIENIDPATLSVSSSETWVTSSSVDVNNGKISLTIDANDTQSDREANIKVEGTDTHGYTCSTEFTLTQEGLQPNVDFIAPPVITVEKYTEEWNAYVLQQDMSYAEEVVSTTVCNFSFDIAFENCASVSVILSVDGYKYYELEVPRVQNSSKAWHLDTTLYSDSFINAYENSDSGISFAIKGTDTHGYTFEQDKPSFFPSDLITYKETTTHNYSKDEWKDGDGDHDDDQYSYDDGR